MSKLGKISSDHINVILISSSVLLILASGYSHSEIIGSHGRGDEHGFQISTLEILAIVLLTISVIIVAKKM